MLASILKIAGRIAILVLASAAIISLFDVITIPSIDMAVASSYLNMIYSIGLHYVPFFSVLWTIGLILFTLEGSMFIYKFALIGYKFVFKATS